MKSFTPPPSSINLEILIRNAQHNHTSITEASGHTHLSPKGIPEIKECGSDACFFGRSNPETKHRRVMIEYRITEQVNQQFPDKSVPLNILSVGSGFLMQDLIIIGTFMLCG